MARTQHLVMGITGATGAAAAALLIERSPWPVTLVASHWGQRVVEHEWGPYAELRAKASRCAENDDLFDAIASGSVETAGMAILPCSANTLAHVASGFGDTLISRAAHCHLKERRPLVLCLRESPLSRIDLENALRVADAGGVILPMTPPFYMHGKRPSAVSLEEVLTVFVDRVLAVLGHPAPSTWEDVR
jgi:4-hydroxy-3-polyprenylbenzoate decarboxylase